MSENLICVIDIGTGKIFGIAGYLINSDVEIRGTEITNVPEKLITKGRVADIEGVTDLLFEVITSLSDQVKERIRYVTIGIGGGFIKGDIYSKKMDFSQKGKEISESDIEFLTREMKNSIVASQETGRRILKILPYCYVIDGQHVITKSPVGMHGNSIEMKVLGISVEINPLQDFIHCVERAGCEVEHVFPHSWACGEATLTEEEKEMGCCVIDIGKGTTDIAIFFGGSILKIRSIRIGGRIIDSDISKVLHTPIEYAEELKKNYGYVNYKKMKAEKTAELNKEVEIFSPSGKISGTVKVEKISEIVYARVYEILADYVRPVIIQHSLSIDLGAGIILTGGGAKLKGIEELTSEIFNLPVRIGTPIKTFNLDKNFHKPEFSSGFGLFSLASKQLKKRQVTFIEKVKMIIKKWF